MSPTISFEIRVCDPARGAAPIRTLRKEFDTAAWEVFSQTERDVVAFGREATALLLSEAVKKKKRRWFASVWRKILPWSRTGNGPSASAA